MALNGIDGGIGLNVPGQLRNPAGAAERRPTQTPHAGTPSAAAMHAPSAESSLPVEPPPGTDPALWSVLTSEERVFFARVRSLGPLTYAPGARVETQGQPLPRGGRLDVRV
jgi:hypothetical protein